MAVCQFIPSVCVCLCVCGYLSGRDYVMECTAMDPLKMVSKETETCRDEF